MTTTLIEAVGRYTESQPGDGPFCTAIEGLVLFRSNLEKPPNHVLFRPALCIVVQGAKWVMFGDRRFDYRAGQALVVSLDMPLLGRVAEATEGTPYLGMAIGFDPALMAEVLENLNPRPRSTAEPRRGLFVADLTDELTDCALRLVRLLDQPRAIDVLRPLILKEIYYWLLTGPHGDEIADITLSRARPRNIFSAIQVLRSRFAEPIRVEELAEIARMSPSAFHRQFKAITSTSPLQYQKNLRLLEARRLLMSGATNVETTAFQVGYESASQFNREYARMFGAPPRRDIVGFRSRIVVEPSAASAV